MIPTTEEFDEAGGGLYSCMKTLPDGEVAWVGRLIFTCAVYYGWRPHGHLNRWCYPTLADARRALLEWDGTGEPDGWHRHPYSGRRRDLATGDEWVAP